MKIRRKTNKFKSSTFNSKRTISAIRQATDNGEGVLFELDGQPDDTHIVGIRMNALRSLCFVQQVTEILNGIEAKK